MASFFLTKAFVFRSPTDVDPPIEDFLRMPHQPDGFADEHSLFTEDEFAAAFELITSPAEAKELAQLICLGREPDDQGGPWALSPDVLDLLSLVSAECAERVRTLLSLTAEEAHARREEVKKALEEHQS